jgi:predicted kinase
VCSDLAFLSMDLAWQGHADLAERLLASYARQANDYDLYALVDFYESYRAYVRGKIAAFGAADVGAPEHTRARHARAARRSLLLALAAHRRSLLSPAVVAVGGLIASGKSTIADRIGEELSAPVISADATRKHMVGAAATQPIHEPAFRGAYDPAFTERVYAEVLRRARVVLASGRPVVLDASFRTGAMRAQARQLAAEVAAPFQLVECSAPREVCRERLRRRAAERSVSDGRLEIFDDFCARFEPVRELPPRELLVLDTTRPVEESLAEVRARLAVWPSGLVA